MKPLIEFDRLPAGVIKRIHKHAQQDGLDVVGFAWRVEVEAERQIVAQLVTLLPGTHYMDPPDGGSVSVMDQLRRMAEDAANWRAGSTAMPSARDVLAERERQQSVEGWTSARDDLIHANGELALAASCYALPPARRAADGSAPSWWPWSRVWWKPKDARRDLVRAAALILAEIERLDRAAERAAQTQEAARG